MGGLSGMLRCTAAGTAGLPHGFEGMETIGATVGIGTRGQLSTQETEGRVKGIEKSPGYLFQKHGNPGANSMPAPEFPTSKTRVHGGVIKASVRNPCLWFAGWQVYYSGQVG